MLSNRQKEIYNQRESDLSDKESIFQTKIKVKVGDQIIFTDESKYADRSGIVYQTDAKWFTAYIDTGVPDRPLILSPSQLQKELDVGVCDIIQRERGYVYDGYYSLAASEKAVFRAEYEAEHGEIPARPWP